MATSVIDTPKVIQQTTATMSSKLSNTELNIRSVGKVVQGHFIFRIDENLENFEELVSGFPTNSLRKQTLGTCVGGSNIGKSGRFAIYNGKIFVFYTGAPLNVGDTWCVQVDFIAD